MLAFLVVSGVVGWVLPDLIVGPRRLAPLTFRLSPLAFGVGGFWLAALAFGPTWVALLVGGLLGVVARLSRNRHGRFDVPDPRSSLEWRGPTALPYQQGRA